MKMKPLAVILVVLLLSPFIFSTASDLVKAEEAEFAGGSGTEEDPYLVATPADLDNVRNHLGAHFVQTQYIDLSGYSNWTPIGTAANPFTGTYNGMGKKISNLTISEAGSPASQQRGLFCWTSNTAILQSIYLENVTINSWYIAGSLAAQNQGIIRNCKIVSGSVAGNEQIGGLVGINRGLLTGCYSHATVSVQLATAGGLVGCNLDGTVELCYATGNVTGGNQVGGLIGEHSCNWQPIAVSNSFASGNISGSSQAGGLIGYVSGGQNTRINDCFATGDVNLPADGTSGGGLIGFLYGKALNCYSTGAVTGGSSDIGGLVGKYFSGGIAVNSYYDTETSGRSDTGRGIPKTTAEMMAGAPSPDIFTGWDADIWSFAPDNQYPLLGLLKGSIKINFIPADVLEYNPLWSVNGGITWLGHADAYPVPAGLHTVNFKKITGWTEPQDLTVEIFANTYAAHNAYYARESYMISIYRVPEEGGTVTGGGTYLFDSPVTLTAYPAAGYHFVAWGMGKLPISTDNPYSFKATGTRVMWARFEQNVYTIAAAASPAEGGTVTGGGTYTHGDSVTLTAVPNPGYIFINWTENGLPVPDAANSYTFTADSERNLVANFVQPGVRRISGTNRFGTAVEVSKQGWADGAQTVVLARGDDYADALAGVPLAYQLNAPILLTNTNRLTASTKAEIIRLGADKVIILGGTGAVSEAVALELQGMGLTVQRIAGSGRYETAALIAKEMATGGSLDTAFVAVGTNFADALSASAYAARAGCPILLAQSTRLPAHTQTALTDLGITNTWVIGGAGVINDTVFAQLPGAERIAGDNRYSTGIALAEKFMPEGTKVMFLATGLDFPDAIAGGVLAAMNSSGVLLVRGDRATPNPAVQGFLAAWGMKFAGIFGGAGAVSSDLETWLRDNMW